jgi:hypothetical protein
MKLVLLHALPLEGAMWSGDLLTLAGSVAPNLYQLGDSLEAWAAGVLDIAGDAAIRLLANGGTERA